MHRRRAWLRECAFIGASYALTGALLGSYAITDTVPVSAGLVYAVPGMLLSAVIAWLIASGRTSRFADPSLSFVHYLASVGLALLGVALYPELAFGYALSLFTVVLTAAYRIRARHVQMVLVVVAVLFGVLTLGLGRRLHIPDTNPGERILSWVFYIVILGRCVTLSVINTHSNRVLRQRGLDMKAKLAEIERLAHHDELTGAYNRRRMLEILDEERVRQDRNGQPVSVALLDLDHFKAVNDTLGHLAGDEVLKRFAKVVQAEMRTTDRFGRHGGEEFLIVLSGVDADGALLAVDRIRAAVALLDWSDIAPALRVTFSAGIAAYNGYESVEVLLGRADLGLYEAKRCGRNCSRAL